MKIPSSRTSRRSPIGESVEQAVPGSKEDTQLAAAYLRGEVWAVHKVQEWLKQVAWRYARELRQPQEDLVQELFLEVTGALRRGTFRGESQLKTYLFRLANFYCLNQLRSQRRRLMEQITVDEIAEGALRSTDASPLDSILIRDMGRRLAALFAQIEPGCRQLWTMIFAGKSYNEMSQELGVAAGALRVRVLRCRRKAAALWTKLRAERGEARP